PERARTVLRCPERAFRSRGVHRGVIHLSAQNRAFGFDRCGIDRSVLGLGPLDQLTQALPLHVSLDELLDVGGHPTFAGALSQRGERPLVEGEGHLLHGSLAENRNIAHGASLTSRPSPDRRFPPPRSALSQRAVSVARDSRTTVTRIWPG